MSHPGRTVQSLGPRQAPLDQVAKARPIAIAGGRWISRTADRPPPSKIDDVQGLPVAPMIDSSAASGFRPTHVKRVEISRTAGARRRYVSRSRDRTHHNRLRRDDVLAEFDPFKH